MDAREAAERIERELLILTRHKEMRAPRGPRGGDPLDQSAYVLLNRLETQGPMSIPDFVEAFGLAASTFTRQTSALLRNGLVERTLDPAGGVARKFRITEEGHRLLSEQREGIVTGLSSVVADWTPERLGRFIADLRQFNTDIERITGRPWPRGAEDTDGTTDAAGTGGVADAADTDGAAETDSAAETADEAGPVAPSALSAATADRD